MSKDEILNEVSVLTDLAQAMLDEITILAAAAEQED